MKKRYLFLSLVGLILGYIAKTDYWFEDEREVYFPITKEQLRAHAKALQTNPSLQQSLNLNRHSQDELSFFLMLKNKMNSEYPTQSNLNSKYEREVARRLSLLKTMQHQWPDQKSYKQINPQELKNYFHSLARNEKENILVRRQAYKNWLSLSNQQELKNEKLIEHNKERLAQLVNFSDAEMIDSLTSETEN